MARLTALVVVVVLSSSLLSAAAQAAPEEPEVCADYELVFGIELNAIASAPDGLEEGALGEAVSASEQLAAYVADELHKNEECEVAWAKIKKACRRDVEAGEFLEDSGFTLEFTGRMYDMEIVEKVRCPDGSYKVRYQARGVKVPDNETLEDIQTRFMEVFDSTYSTQAN